MFNLSTGRIAALTLIALSILQFVNAHVVRRESNGERLARGLPPAHPKRFYDPFRHVVRHDASATPTSDIITTTDTSTPTKIDPTSTPTDAPTSVTSDPPSSTPSSTPPPESDTPSSAPPSSTPSSATPSSTQPAPNPTGYITLRKVNAPLRKRDDVFGYMGDIGMGLSLPGPGVPGPTAWLYTFVRPNPADSVVELNAIPPPGYGALRLGCLNGMTYAGFATLAPGSTSWLQLTNVRGHSAAGAQPSWMQTRTANGYAETTIFSIDPETNEITVNWVNTDGSIAKTYVVEYSTPQWSNGLYVTGDLATLAAKLGTNVSNLNVVRLFFVEVPSTSVS